MSETEKTDRERLAQALEWETFQISPDGRSSYDFCRAADYVLANYVRVERAAMAIQHSPGPWTGHPSEAMPGFVEVDSADPSPDDRRNHAWEAFAYVAVTLDGEDSEVGRRNLALILAAPELLAVCRIALSQPLVHGVQQLIKAAIASASGEAP